MGNDEQQEDDKAKGMLCRWWHVVAGKEERKLNALQQGKSVISKFREGGAGTAHKAAKDVKRPSK
jgi:hypothetical protein